MRTQYSQTSALGSEDGKQLIAGFFGDVAGGEDQAKANADHASKCVNQHDKFVEALKYISTLHGNLPLDGLEKTCGPHEGASRGIKLMGAIELAREVLANIG